MLWFLITCVILKAWPLLFKQVTNTKEKKNLVSNWYALLDSSRFSQSDCGSPTAKTYANKRIVGKNNYTQRDRTSDI